MTKAFFVACLFTWCGLIINEYFEGEIATKTKQRG